MINNLTAHYFVCKEQYKKLYREFKELKQEFVIKTQFNGFCLFCGKLCTEKVCTLCLKNNFLKSELTLINANNELKFQLEIFEAYNLKSKHYEKYNFESKGSCFEIFNTEILLKKFKLNKYFKTFYGENEKTEKFFLDFENIYNIYNFKILNKKKTYFFKEKQVYTSYKSRISLSKMKLLNTYLFEIFNNLKNKVNMEDQLSFYKNRIDHKINIIDEQIETNDKNLKNAIKNDQFDDAKAFKEVNDLLWYNKKELEKRKWELNFK